jgi:hypothetical protein
LGLFLTLVGLVRQRWRLWNNEQQMQDLLFLGLFAGPLLAVMVLHSVLYDGWRQLYFIYPAFLLLALRGWVQAAKWRPRGWWPTTLYGVTALSLVLTAAQMVRDHPLQNVYFNALAGTNVGERFELDYWGVGFRLDLEHIVKNDDRPEIKVYINPPGPREISGIMLPPEHLQRLNFVSTLEEADYFATNYRWHPEPYPYDFEVFQLRADGRRVHSVFRLRW